MGRNLRRQEWTPRQADVRLTPTFLASLPKQRSVLCRKQQVKMAITYPSVSPSLCIMPQVVLDIRFKNDMWRRLEEEGLPPHFDSPALASN